MRPDSVVMLAPVFDHDACLGPVPEPFHIQARVAQLTVKTLGRAVLPGLARGDQRRLNALIRNPLQQSARDELRAIVRTQISGSSAVTDDAGLYLDHSARAD